MSGPSLRSAIDAKCRDCGGQEGGERFWRLHVSACPIMTCSLWTVRPIASRNAPPWLASRRIDDLPAGFAAMATETVIASLRPAVSLLSPETGNMGAEPADLAPVTGGGAHG
jgi:hypothetical protein